MIVNLATDERRRVGRAAIFAPKLATAGECTDSYPSDLSDLLGLPARVRALLYMVEVEGQQIAPAAEAVGMSSGNARVALLRARRRLRAELNEELSGE
jgi:DNA-directed RNA polymerase specialized sigma24 family protein